ncbi:MAG: glycosyltransferase [Bacteroidetes bacterium]|nr:glycosyltransferase [Bacteroidota bacterium]MBS1609313.1 glycosyltransferase [Bacteroidota bacterium]
MKKPGINELSVLFFVPSPLGISPGQRFRFEQYLPEFEERGMRYCVRPFLSLRGRKCLYSEGNIFGKVSAILGGYWRRVKDMFIIHRYEYVYIHRWATTAGPPVFEWIIAKIFRKKIIYDFDDAIWLNESRYNKKFLSFKFLSKVGKICKWAHTVTVGNTYLHDFALKYNKNVIIIPTVVNTQTVHAESQDHDVIYPNVGWTGSFSTLQYLDIILPALQALQERIDFTFYVIADQDPRLALKKYVFIKWDSESEAKDLLKFHIGLMPLTDNEYSKGKCGFKAIQYMAMGMPAVVSPVGVNATIVEHGQNGFLCSSQQEWENYIELLLKDPSLRKKLGNAARKKIERNYSVIATKDFFFGLFAKAPKRLSSFTAIFLTILSQASIY